MEPITRRNIFSGVGVLLFIALILYRNPANSQCAVKSIGIDSIFCGNSKKLTVDISWKTTSTNFSGVLNALCFTSYDTGYAVGEGGTILKTVNGANSWNTIYSGGVEFKCIQFFGDSVGYVSGGTWGAGPSIIKTVNKGVSWQSLTLNLGSTKTIRDMKFISNDTGYIVGGDDLYLSYFIAKTTNGGQSWSILDSGTSYTFTKVFFLDALNGFVTSNDGKIFKTTNGGATWNTLFNNSVYQFTKLYFTNQNKGYGTAYGYGNTYFAETNNGGISWTFKAQSTLNISGTNELKDFAFTDSLTGYLFSHQVIYKTIDGGLTWNYYNQGPGEGSYAYFMLNPTEIYATRNIGYPAKISSLKFPVSYRWSPNFYLSDSTVQDPEVSPNIATTYYLKATFKSGCVAFDSVYIKVRPMWAGLTKLTYTINCGYAAELGTVTSYNNSIPLNYRWSPTTGLDNPSSSQPKASPVTNTKYYLNVSTFNNCEVPDSNDNSLDVFVNPMQINAGVDRTIICGDSLQIIPQQPWIPQSTFPYQFNSIYFIDKDTGFAISGSIYKTVNGGTSWDVQYMVSGSLQKIFFLNRNNGYVIGDGGLFFKTTNGGNSWQLNYVTNYPNVKTVYFTHIDTGYVAGSNGVIRKTSNGGTTWVLQPSNTTNTLNSIYFTSSSIGFVIGNGGVIRKTINGGSSWTTISSGVTTDLTGITFISPNKGFIIGAGNILLKTIDGGNTWTFGTSTGIWEPNSICFKDSLTGYVVGKIAATSGISYTNDGGITWNTQYYGYTDIRSVFVINSSKVLAIGETSLLIKPDIIQNYTWENLTNHVIETNQYLNPVTTTKYVVTANKAGCFASDTINIYVSPLTVNIVPDVLGNMNLVCGSIYTPDSITCNLPWEKVKYSWDSLPGISDIHSLHPNFLLKKDALYTLKVTTSNGCNASDSIRIFVNPFRVSIPYHYLENPDYYKCGTKYIPDSIYVNSAESGIVYSWSPSSGISDSTKLIPVFTLKDDRRYYLKATTPSGCIATDSFYVKVFPLHVDAGNDKNSNCGALTIFDSVTLDQMPDSVNNLRFSFKWSPSIGLNSDTIKNPGTYLKNISYKLTVTGNTGCTATDSIRINLVKGTTPSICLLTVGEDNRNLIVWEKKSSMAFDSVFIYKESNMTGQYQKLSALNYKNFSTYEDMSSNSMIQASKYKISFHDSCGLETDQSPAHKTMHLTINKGIGNNWNLLWNFYEGFQANTYNIYRGTDSLNLTLIGSTSGANNSYTDINAPVGSLYYQVEIISPYSCNPSKTINTSRSNYMSTRYSGVSDLKAPEFTLYPIPMEDKLHIAWQGENKLQLLIYNMQGNQLISKEIVDYTDQIYVNEIPAGMYVIEIRGQFGLVRKLVLKN